MKPAAESRQYVRDFLEAHEQLSPEVIETDARIRVRNADDTEHLHPWQHGGSNFSWFDYWCAFVHRTPPIPNCSSMSHDNIFEIAKEAKQQPPKVIVGAHVQISYDNGATWSDEMYIIPLCVSCNNKHGQELHIRSGIKMVEMVDPYEKKVSKGFFWDVFL